MEPAHERRWRGLDAGAGPREEVEWSYRIPKQIGVEWSWWSGVAVLGVECSQTGPISVSLVINTYSLRVENRRRLKQRRSLQSIILTT